MAETVIFLSSIPPRIDHETLIELCETFGEIKHTKRLMDSQGVFLDFMFLIYKDERSIYYIKRHLDGLNLGEYCVELSNINENEVILSFKNSEGVSKMPPIEDKEMAYKLKNVLGKIKWKMKINNGLHLLDSGKTLEMLKINKIKDLQETILKKLKNRTSKPNVHKLHKFLGKFLDK
ncbi:hypothetical protein NGRA_0810 [Nosema granulosis]|uniref:RRM domain-containing protein n=1 Tax=Nosema granulosis TaxID=83296 RepID=A0A9P6GZP7_9MICR|nr:hypothetical protein NGRA_0810 [Nosema granulosis]